MSGVMQNAQFKMQNHQKRFLFSRVCMLHFAFCISVFVLSLTQVFTAPQTAAAPAAAAPAADAEKHLGTIKQYCVACHNDRTKTAGVSFEGMTPASISEHADVFEKAVRKLRGRVMPPPGSRQPDASTADALVAWLETSLDKAAGHAHVPDTIVLHRLNRK